MPVVPTVLGFDPRLQFMHEDDAVDLLEQAVQRPIVGTYNATADGVLYLSQLLRMGGRVELPLPLSILNLTGPLVRLARRGLQVPPHIIRLVQWGRIADNRRLKEEFGFTPRYTTRDAVREFYAERRLRRVAEGGRPQRWERELHEFLTRKGQERFLEKARAELQE
jgi:UDP-glucose 4-epimerase